MGFEPAPGIENTQLIENTDPLETLKTPKPLNGVTQRLRGNARLITSVLVKFFRKIPQKYKRSKPTVEPSLLEKKRLTEVWSQAVYRQTVLVQPSIESGALR